MTDGEVATLIVGVWFVLLGVLALALVGFAVWMMVRSGQQKDATISRAHAEGVITTTPGAESGTWQARFVPDMGLAGALLPFSGVRRRGLVRLLHGHLEFWPHGASAPAWVTPIGQVRVRMVDFAVGRLAAYPLRLSSPASGRLLGEVSLEPLGAMGELDLKDQRNHEYSRHFVHVLLAAGAQPLT